MVTRSPQFADGTYDFNLDSDTPIRRWELYFDGHLDTDPGLIALDTLASDAKYNDEAGSAYDFDFTTRTGEVVKARFDRGGYERIQTKTYIQGRRVKLIHYP